MTRREAEQLVDAMRERILSLFPGRDATYELIYARRFRRLIDEFARPDHVSPGSVIPFGNGDR